MDWFNILLIHFAKQIIFSTIIYSCDYDSLVSNIQLHQTVAWTQFQENVNILSKHLKAGVLLWALPMGKTDQFLFYN